jgi:triphosphatase
MRKLVRLQTAERLKKLDREVRHAIHKPKDADAIHDLRVSIRRLRQELRIFKAWFEAEDVKGMRRSLRKLMDRCAAVRNCDIAIEVLRAAGCHKRKLVAGLEKERQRTREELARKLESWRKEDRARSWRDHLQVRHSSSQESVGEHARRLLPAMLDDLFRAGRAATRPDANHQKMHRFRLKTKRVRYTLELFEVVYAGATKQVMESLKALQDKLGAINDCATTLEMIRLDRDAAEAVRQLADERVVEFRAYWKKHFGPREKVRWKAVLGAADRTK